MIFSGKLESRDCQPPVIMETIDDDHHKVNGSGGCGEVPTTPYDLEGAALDSTDHEQHMQITDYTSDTRPAAPAHSSLSAPIFPVPTDQFLAAYPQGHSNSNWINYLQEHFQQTEPALWYLHEHERRRAVPVLITGNFVCVWVVRLAI